MEITFYEKILKSFLKILLFSHFLFITMAYPSQASSIITMPSLNNSIIISTSSNSNEYISKRNIEDQLINFAAVEEIKWNNSWEFAEFKIPELNQNTVKKYYSTYPNRRNKTVCINAGHGTPNGQRYNIYCHPDKTPKLISGTSKQGDILTSAVSYGCTLNNGLTEAQATLELSYFLKEALLQMGYDCLIIREDNKCKLDNVARTVFANNNADIHISLHYDATNTNKGAFYTCVPYVESYIKMYPINQMWKKHNELGENVIEGLKNHQIKIYQEGRFAIDLVQTSYSTIPSIDLEVGDRCSICTPEEYIKTSLGIAEGIDNFFQNN